MPIQGGVAFFDGGCRIIVLGGVTSGVRPLSPTIPTKTNSKRELAIKNRSRRYWRSANEDQSRHGQFPPHEYKLYHEHLESSDDEFYIEDDEEDEDEVESDNDSDEDDDEEREQPASFDFTWPYGAEETDETWAFNIETETWQQLASTPRPHQGWYLYRDTEPSRHKTQPAMDLTKCAECEADQPKLPCPCSAVRYCGKQCQRKHWKKHRATCLSRRCNCDFIIRAADDPSLNYCVATDTWFDDPTRARMVDHSNASEIVCVELPF